MAAIHRLGVLDRGETAVRVFNAVDGLNDAGDAPPITTVLFHTDLEPHPWYGREADEVVALAVDRDHPDIGDVVAELQRANIDTVWVGHWHHGARADLLEAFERGGIAVVGPDSATVRRLNNASADGARGIGAASPADAPRTRRLEIEVLADDHGTIWALGGRDVSVRRAGRSLIAEAPCVTIGDEFAARLRDAATEHVRQLDYRGAGVVTFVHDDHDFSVVAVDPLAAPEHATTEERTGASIIGWRLRVQRGEPLTGGEPTGEGHAIEARILAEDPEAGFATTTGTVSLLSFPVGTGVRVDANRRVGDPVDEEDPLIAVITAWGKDRAVALGRLRRALERTSIVIEGGATNRTFLLSVLRQPDHARDEIDDGWLDRSLTATLTTPPAPVALVAAAVESYEADRTVAQASFYASAARGRPEPPGPIGRHVELSYRGTPYDLEVDRTGSRSYSVRHGQEVADVTVDALDAFERRVTCGGRRHRVLVTPSSTGFRIEIDGCAHVVDREDGIVVRAGWPALVVAALVQPGQEVERGEPIAVLESMKMETTVTAPFAGTVTSVLITANTRIDSGAPLLRLRAHRAAELGPAAAVSLRGLEQRVDFTRKACKRAYEPLGNYLLGYDLAPAVLDRLLAQQRRLAEIAEPTDTSLVACEDGFLDLYADLGALYRPQTEPVAEEFELAVENTQEYLVAFAQWLDPDRAGLPDGYQARLVRALGRYGVHSLERTPALEAALMWLFRSFGRVGELSPVVLSILERRLAHRDELAPFTGPDTRARLERLAASTQGRQQAIADLARDVRFHYVDEPPMEAAAALVRAEMSDHIAVLAATPDVSDRPQRIDRLVWCPHPMRSTLMHQWWKEDAQTPDRRETVLEVHIRRFYRIRQLGEIRQRLVSNHRIATTDYVFDGHPVHLAVGYLPLDQLPSFSRALAEHLASLPRDTRVVVDAVTWRPGSCPSIDETRASLLGMLAGCEFGRPLHRLDIAVTSSEGAGAERFRTHDVTFRQRDGGEWYEDTLYQDLHPMLAKRMELWRLAQFELERRPSPDDVYLFLGVARTNPADRRLFALGEVRELDPVVDPESGEVSYPRLERTGLQALAAMRAELARYTSRDRPVANRLVLDIHPEWKMPAEHVRQLARRFAPLAGRAGLEKVVLKVRIPDPDAPGGLRDAVLHFEGVGSTVLVREDEAGDQPVRPLSSYQQKVLTAARFGSPYPFEIVRLFTDRTGAAGIPAGTFVELDLEPSVTSEEAATGGDRLVPVDREPGNNTAHVVVGLLTNHTATVPEGMTRVAVLSDPTQGLGNLAEPECRRVNAALGYARDHDLPVDWFAVSSGALIAMDSGTENMDWIALTLRRLIEFTESGGEVNIVVTGINVGGQPYWNAEATMLMHTKGILIMTPASAMVLTGKQALDFSGAVGAEDNFGIGGYQRVMGPNGQAQYWAASFPQACDLLLRHHDLTYVVPGERFPRRHATSDPAGRDVCASPHDQKEGSPFATVGNIFSEELNPERKHPFDMRSVMRAVADADTEPLERWQHLRDGETSIVWDTTIGGIPVCLLGLESHTVARKGWVPADGPPSWTSGTLFPHSSRKTARSINAASGRRPLVVLANLSGFDGSPESMRRRQLEYGAEIGRAVTNFDGPIVFVVISRYHGGAFVVFSKALNPSMEIAAVEGSFASVIGGAPAAATVFAREVKQRTENDPRVREAADAVAGASGAESATMRTTLLRVTAQVRSEKLGEVADEFDSIHTIERAQRVGSVDRIIPASSLRPYIVDALERGMAPH